MSDTALIEEINKKLIRPLKQLNKISWITKGYVLNDEGHITHLSVFKSRFKGTVPLELFQLKHLVYLDIRENDMTELPDSIRQLKALRYIDARNNKLSQLPVGITELDALERLYLGQNNYSEIPKQIGDLKHINLLDLSDNEIGKGCEELLKAQNLRNIYLNNNQLRSFPFDKVADNQLDELVLIDNPLEDQHGMIRHKIERLIL